MSKVKKIEYMVSWSPEEENQSKRIEYVLKTRSRQFS